MGGFLTSLVIIDKFDQGGKKEKWKNFSGGEHQISGWKPADNAVSQQNFVLSNASVSLYLQKREH